MRLEDHEKSCLEFFGQAFTQVHLFLDQYMDPSYPVLTHRRILHHKAGVEIIVKKFGEQARCPATLHIMEDGLLRPDGEIIHHWNDWDWLFFRGKEEIEEQHHLLSSIFGAGYTHNTKKMPNYLFVDDDPYILDLYKSFFAEKAAVTIARNGTEALAKTRSRHFDAIVSDVDMPVTNGIHLFKQLHAADPTTRERFIFCTGNISKELHALSTLYEVEIIRKPILFKQLEDTLCRMAPASLPGPANQFR